jgi:hypothetical protein
MSKNCRKKKFDALMVSLNSLPTLQTTARILGNES